MTRALAALFVVCALGACTPDPQVHAEQEWILCQGAVAFDDRRINACSAVISDTQTDAHRRAEALIRRGVLRGEAGEQARAIADFGRALRIDANNAAAYAERGLVHQTRGAYEVAVRDYDTALMLQPGFQLAAQRREEALQGQGQAALSQLEDLNQLIAANPDNPTLWNNRCWERAVRGVELDFALSDCDRAIMLDPNFSAALDSRGLVHYKRGEFAAAISDYDAALAIEPGTGHYLYGRGLARAGMGDNAGAQADFLAAQRAQPDVVQRYRSYGISI